MLQWVRGPKTAVSSLAVPSETDGCKMLQWVRGPKTAVSIKKLTLFANDIGFNGSAVRRPRLAAAARQIVAFDSLLQWVRGPKTAVSRSASGMFFHWTSASMGPRSEDRG